MVGICINIFEREMYNDKGKKEREREIETETESKK
jgi:hypothetical protein